MHVLFVSACEKRAIRRTRAVLDSYALRTGEKAWASPMTQEGLREIRMALKATATRQTAVACYRNEGRQRMKLLWVVGSRHAFGPDGHFPAGTTQGKASEPPPTWVRVASLLAQAAGWCHDLGKASVLFQDKLRGIGPMKDCVRHEWVSMRLAQAMRDGKSWNEAWEKVERNQNWLKDDPFEDGIQSAWDALDYLVVTHHRLLGPTANGGTPDSSHHFSKEPLKGLKPKAILSSEPFDTAKRLMERVEKLADHADHRFWRAVANIARAGLILADHDVSADDHVPKDGPAINHALYANTNNDKRLNQELFGHLKNVANSAADKVYRIASLKLPGLSEEAVESICQTAGQGFDWQNRAADALSALRGRSSSPVLVFNMAATGSGKTRMNARAACLLSNGPVRFAVALNLRTLTLQTGDALRREFSIGEDELACVIGDKVTQRLHEQNAKPDEDSDGNSPEDEFETSPGEFSIPAWLEPLAKTKPVLKAVVGAQVLVSTVDFLIAAGMPHTQGHYASALLRLVGSDLILDEVDGYDPKPLVAILRLVQMAAQMGRNVICSTATLSEPVADAIYAAYLSGAALRGAMTSEEVAFTCAMIDNYAEPSIAENGMGLDFKVFYRQQIEQARPKFSSGGRRVPYLQTVLELSGEAWQQAVLSAVKRLHDDHGFVHAASGKRISFGLVRVANIKGARPTARFLAQNLPQARVACYHSQDFVIQRFMKERRLDHLLTRKSGSNGNQRIQQDLELASLLEQAQSDNVPFIVVATPVEEVGRDHDFDWAVIEPSSVRSIVQTAGRVNRHRNDPVASPNIALLQYNWRAVSREKLVFTRPGFEREDSHPCHDLGSLLNWEGLLSIDASLMFDGHCFAQSDNASIESELENVLGRLFDADNAEPCWVNQGIYEEYPLRTHEPRYEFMLDADGNYKLWLQEKGKKPDWVIRNDLLKSSMPRLNNDWLSWHTDELIGQCEELGLSLDQGMRLSVRRESFEADLSFGVY